MHMHTADEAARYVGATLRAALGDPSVDAWVHQHPVTVRIGLVDPDCVLYLDTTTHEVRIGTDADVAESLVAMAGDTALAYLLGRVDIDAAEESGEVIADGESRSLLEVLASLGRLPAVCADVLRREGRTDLLAPAS